MDTTFQDERPDRDGMPPELLARVESTNWYHTIDLPGGYATRGWVDVREAPDRCGMPASLEGQRCLDIGTANGFWAFEMERRGASEVVALDVDDPRTQLDYPDTVPIELRTQHKDDMREGFEVAREALGSQVQRVSSRIYDLDADEHGRFDFVFMGSFLLHIQDPVAGLRAVRRVLAPGGELLSADSISMGMTLRYPRTPAAKLSEENYGRWWTPNIAGHRRLLATAGFEPVAEGKLYFMRFGDQLPRRPKRLRDLTPYRLRWLLFERRFGTACTWARCRPFL